MFHGLPRIYESVLVVTSQYIIAPCHLDLASRLFHFFTCSQYSISQNAVHVSIVGALPLRYMWPSSNSDLLKPLDADTVLSYSDPKLRGGYTM